ncbi:MAG TPA: hypothetical protein VG166_11130 [Caulobacteraceae bacterium]|nr:hypothetical protein [Caulobacteraceae bacterium]
MAWRLAGGPWVILAVLGMLISRAVLWRRVLGGVDERLPASVARLAAAWLLGGLFLAMLLLLLLVTLLACAYAVASAGPGFDAKNVATWANAIQGRGRWPLGAAALAGCAGLIFAAGRISLAEPASLAEGRIQVLSTWALSRRTWPAILIGNAVIAAPGAALFLTGPATPLWRGLQGVILAGVWLPMNVGLMAYVFERSGAQTKPDR